MIATDGEGKLTFINAAGESFSAGEPPTFSAVRARHLPFPARGRLIYPVEECRSAMCGRAVRRSSSSTTPLSARTFVSPGLLQRLALKTDRTRGAVVVFADVSQQTAERLRVERELEKLSWVGRIRDALDQHRFVLYAQPILDLATNVVVQNELLIRMVTPRARS